MCWFRKIMRKDILVLLVNCHGHDTLGKRSPDGFFREYAWGREINKIILEKLYTKGIKAIIVNPEIEEVKLSIIAERANKLYAQYKDTYNDIILLSPHVNAGPENKWSNASGWTGYVYNKAGKKSLKLARILADLAYDTYSLKGNRIVPEERFLRANFAILRETVMAAVLTENLFMTNHNDVDFLISDKGKEIISDLHVNAVLKYIQEK